MERPKAYVYIRMSSLSQLEGDSLRRQKELAVNYSRRNGLELTDPDEWRDLGVSAYTGANIESGKLGKFRELVERGQIAKGSVLLVETFDRLSRKEPINALPFLNSMFVHGISLVTLNNEKIYNNLSELPQLLDVILQQNTSHEESFKKSGRMKASWRAKRESPDRRPMTANCPGWLRLENNTYRVVPERAEIVKRIFEESIRGLGVSSITKRLNRDRVPTFTNRGKGWRDSSVKNILNNRAVFGEYQPHTVQAKKRTPCGGPWSDHYPTIISQETFDRAEDAKRLRGTRKGGRTGITFSNLFKSNLFCAKCGERIFLRDPGKRSNGHRYLICSRYRRGLSCTEKSWRYDRFERAFLLHSNLPLVLKLVQERTTEDSDNHGRLVITVEDELRRLKVRSDNFENTFGGSPMRPEQRDKWRALEEKIVQLEADLERLKSENRNQTAPVRISAEDIEEALQKAGEKNDALLVRAELSSQVSLLIARIDVGLDGLQDALSADRLNSLVWDQDTQEYMVSRALADDDQDRTAPCFSVNYRGGGGHIVQPNPNEPTAARFYAVKRKDGFATFSNEQQDYIRRQTTRDDGLQPIM